MGEVEGIYIGCFSPSSCLIIHFLLCVRSSVGGRGWKATTTSYTVFMDTGIPPMGTRGSLVCVILLPIISVHPSPDLLSAMASTIATGSDDPMVRARNVVYAQRRNLDHKVGQVMCSRLPIMPTNNFCPDVDELVLGCVEDSPFGGEARLSPSEIRTISRDRMLIHTESLNAVLQHFPWQHRISSTTRRQARTAVLTHKGCILL